MYNDSKRRRDSNSKQILFKNQNSIYLIDVQVNVQCLTVCRIFLGLGYSLLSTCVSDVRRDGVDSSSVADLEVRASLWTEFGFCLLKFLFFAYFLNHFDPE